MKLKFLIPASVIALSLISCEKPSTSTTYVYENTSEPVPVVTTLSAPTPAPVIEENSELDAIAGKHETGKLFLRYNVSSDEIKKWNILAPYEINLDQEYIEITFSGNYYMDGEPTGKGKKRLYIKKENIRTILVSEE